MNNKILKIILLLFFLVLMFISGKNIIEWLKENNHNQDIVREEEKRLIKDKENIILDNNIKKDNPYTIGWLIVDGTNINYPVVKYTDNDYYLNHDFNNQYNSAGWIFMDYRNELEDQNIIIYGHHRRDGSMFGSIEKLFKEKNKDLNISLITNNKTINYKIFSIYKISSNNPYNSPYFKDFKKTIEEFNNRSLISFKKNYQDATQIITLSTCDNNNIDRIVVHGYR